MDDREQALTGYYYNTTAAHINTTQSTTEIFYITKSSERMPNTEHTLSTHTPQNR